jgi:hypothetical protein
MPSPESSYSYSYYNCPSSSTNPCPAESLHPTHAPPTTSEPLYSSSVEYPSNILPCYNHPQPSHEAYRPPSLPTLLRQPPSSLPSPAGNSHHIPQQIKDKQISTPAAMPHDIAHPYSRLVAKKEDKRRRIWNHALEKSLFNPFELYVQAKFLRSTTNLPADK